MLNSTKTWQDRFDEYRDEFNQTFRGLLNTVAKKHSNTYFGEYSDDFEYRRLVHFISELRKKDEDELIKMLPDYRMVFPEQDTEDIIKYKLGFNDGTQKIKQLIKDYYEN